MQLLLLTAVLWSTSGYFAKISTLSPLEMAAYRALSATVFLFPFVKWKEVRFERAMLGMALCFALMNICFIAAMVFTSAANAIILEYTAPFWMFLVGRIWLKEKIVQKNLITLAGGMVGIAVLLLGNWQSSPLGITLGLLAGVTFAGVSLFLRYLRHQDPLWLTFINLAVSAVITVPLVALRTPALTISLKDFINVLLFGVLQTGIPYMLYSKGLQSVTAQEAGIILLLEPTLTPFWAWLAIGEIPTLATIAGGAIILFSLGQRYLPSLKRN